MLLFICTQYRMMTFKQLLATDLMVATTILHKSTEEPKVC